MPKNLTDGTAFAASIQIPVDSDPAGLQYLETGFQGLADRTNYLKKYNEDSTAYTWTKSPLDFRIVNGWTYGTYGNGHHGKLVSAAASDVALMDIFVPGGITLTKVYALVLPGGASGMSFVLTHRLPDFSTPADPDPTAFSSNASSGATLQVLDATVTGGRTVDTDEIVTLRVTSAQAGDEVRAIQIVASITGEGRI